MLRNWDWNWEWELGTENTGNKAAKGGVRIFTCWLLASLQTIFGSRPAGLPNLGFWLRPIPPASQLKLSSSSVTAQVFVLSPVLRFYLNSEATGLGFGGWLLHRASITVGKDHLKPPAVDEVHLKRKYIINSDTAVDEVHSKRKYIINSDTSLYLLHTSIQNILLLDPCTCDYSTRNCPNHRSCACLPKGGLRKFTCSTCH